VPGRSKNKKRRVATHHGREWTRQLRVQTSPVIQPPVRYIHIYADDDDDNDNDNDNAGRHSMISH